MYVLEHNKIHFLISAVVEKKKFEKDGIKGLVLSSALFKITKLLPKMILPIHTLPSSI